MSNYSCDYVRRHNDVPAKIGRRVIANGEPGVIMADRGHYIGVILDSDPKKRIRNHHPTWEMQYGDMAETLPLKQWEVLTNGYYDRDHVRYGLGEARQYVLRIWAATHNQARYRAYQELDECFEDATAMLT